MNTELIREVYAAFSQGDVPGVLGAFDASVSWTEAKGFPYGGTFVGPDAVLANVFVKLGTEWDSYAAVPHTFVAEGDIVVALGDYSGTYKATGKSFSAPFAHVWTIQNGRVVRFHQHTDTAIVQAALT